jgi:thioredoxin reductase (NADPH)
MTEEGTEAPQGTYEQRRAQMFPRFNDAEIARLRRYGEVRRLGPGDVIYATGKPAPGLFVLIAGHVAITHRDGRGHDVPIVEHGPGNFGGELSQLAGSRPALVDGVARDDVELVMIPPAQVRAVLVNEADLGERIMRALILRRVALIEHGGGGPVLIGDPQSPDVVRLRGFLTRNGQPHQVFDPAAEEDARLLVAREVTRPEDLPLVVCPDGTILRNPSEGELAACIGMVDEEEASQHCYDVIVAGAGPAGLATAVYAASEGLSVLVIDARAFGGQAGASARIENYFGFPTGISGQALSGRAYTQAQKFGARMLIPARIEALECDSPAPGADLHVRLASGRRFRGRAVVVATGAHYRRPAIPNLDAFEGRGVSYWASPIEARLCAGQEVALVGGGNSAGQAAVYLAGFASKVWLIVRRDGLDDTMSRYLIDRIAGLPNVELVPRTEIVALKGAETGLVGARWRGLATGEETECAVRHIFLFAGAEPATQWLAGCGVELDEKGFVKTGRTCRRVEASLGTSIPGVFAVGDARSGSVKRVGAAIGEGAMAVAQIHGYLAERSPGPVAAGSTGRQPMKS